MGKVVSQERCEALFAQNSELAWELSILEETESTMSVARERIQQGAIQSPFLALAERQSGGRGRQGRVWNSGPGGFYATYVLPCACSMADLGGFSLVVGVVIRRILAEAGASLSLKWPNDLVAADGRKLGGILIEVVSAGDGALMLVGVGVNFDNQIDSHLAVTVRELGAGQLSIEEFAVFLARELERARNVFIQEGLSPFLSEWRESDFLSNKTIAIDDSGSHLTGIVRGITDQGALMLEVGGAIQAIWSGHIVSISGVAK